MSLDQVGAGQLRLVDVVALDRDRPVVPVEAVIGDGEREFVRVARRLGEQYPASVDTGQCLEELVYGRMMGRVAQTCFP